MQAHEAACNSLKIHPYCFIVEGDIIETCMEWYYEFPQYLLVRAPLKFCFLNVIYNDPIEKKIVLW